MPRTSTQNLISFNSNGEPRAIFPGGVEILAVESFPDPTPPDERRVRWVRESDGVLVADVQGAESGNQHYGQLVSYAPAASGGGQTYTRISAKHRVPTDILAAVEAAVECEAVEDLGTMPGRHVRAIAQDKQVLIIDDDRQSSFLQIPQARHSYYIWGQVGTNGSTVRAGSGMWSCVRTAAGDYTVTSDFTLTHESWLPVFVLVGGATWGTVGLVTVTADNFRYMTRNSAGVLTDYNHVFHAIGR